MDALCWTKAKSMSHWRRRADGGRMRVAAAQAVQAMDQ